jgi:ribulose-5-phosphate 4-epimerase/fuculose-1-phosphate aldolase
VPSSSVSRRKQNYNLPGGTDLVRVEFSEDKVTAYGGKPSAGTRSQWAVLQAFPDYDCIVHFHCPSKAGSEVVIRPQHDFECGSHECGENTKAGMSRFAGGVLAAVMLDKHGPNIIFNRHVDPQVVIDFIEANFDLTKRSDEE